MKRLLAILTLIALLMSGVEAEQRAPSCAMYDLTGRYLAETIAEQAQVTCVYKRLPTAEECPHNSPQGLTLVGVVNPGNRDKISCIYQTVGG